MDEYVSNASEKTKQNQKHDSSKQDNKCRYKTHSRPNKQREITSRPKDTI